jgi:hypothetical protein
MSAFGGKADITALPTSGVWSGARHPGGYCADGIEGERGIDPSEVVRFFWSAVRPQHSAQLLDPGGRKSTPSSSQRPPPPVAGWVAKWPFCRVDLLGCQRATAAQASSIFAQNKRIGNWPPASRHDTSVRKVTSLIRATLYDPDPASAPDDLGSDANTQRRRRF